MRRVIFMVVTAWCAGCSGDQSGAARGGDEPGAARAGMTGDECTAGAQRACVCAGGSTGTQSCDLGWSACECTPNDFGNAGAGGTGSAGGTGGAGSTGGGQPVRRRSCEPGLYLGTYTCDLVVFGLPAPLMGDVAFNLEVDEEAIENECDAEFCPDLVIAEGSGVLFGIAVGWGFEAALEGGLDCQTGEFRTLPLKGRYGSAVSTDPADPDAVWTVLNPPLGEFAGDLAGRHVDATPQRIEGEWTLVQEGFASCAGTFTTELQP